MRFKTCLTIILACIYALPLDAQEVDISGTWKCQGTAKFSDGSTQTAESTVTYTSTGGNSYEWTMSGTAVQTAPRGYRYPSTRSYTNEIPISSSGIAELNGDELTWWVGSADDSEDSDLPYHAVQGTSRVTENRIESVSASGRREVVSSSSTCTR